MHSQCHNIPASAKYRGGFWDSDVATVVDRI